MKLAMDISTDNNWSSDWYNIGLLCKYFFSLVEKALTFSQRALISDSGRGLQVSNYAICLSTELWSLNPLVVIDKYSNVFNQ